MPSKNLSESAFSVGVMSHATTAGGGRKAEYAAGGAYEPVFCAGIGICGAMLLCRSGLVGGCARREVELMGDEGVPGRGSASAEAYRDGLSTAGSDGRAPFIVCWIRCLCER